MGTKFISHYRLVERIGAEGLTEAYRAFDERVGREVAIRIFDPQPLMRDVIAERQFRDAVRIVSSVSSPNLASIYDIGESEGKIFLVTESIEGESLSDKIGRGRLLEEEATHIALQIGGALAALHKRGIVHRSLNPSNVFITPQGQVKLVDFAMPIFEGWRGLGTELTRLRGAARFVAYMAPEQLQFGTADKLSDIYSFGAVLYSIVTGRMPFEAKTVSELIETILNEREPNASAFSPNLSTLLRVVITKCMEKIPDNRFHSMQDVIGMLSESGYRKSYRLSEEVMAYSLSTGAVSITPGFKDVLSLAGVSLPIARTMRLRFADLMFVINGAMLLVGLIQLRGTILGFGMTFGASLLLYECYLLRSRQR
jgi:serine/threonine protein kinase